MSSEPKPHIPSANEVLREYNSHVYPSDWRTEVAMRKFAEMHVKRALQRAAEEADFTIETYNSMQEGSTCEIDKDSILNSFNYEDIQ